MQTEVKRVPSSISTSIRSFMYSGFWNFGARFRHFFNKTKSAIIAYSHSLSLIKLCSFISRDLIDMPKSTFARKSSPDERHSMPKLLIF